MGNSAPAATTAEVEQEGRYHQQQQSDRQDEDDHDWDEEEDGSGGDDDDDDVLPSTINLSNLSLDSPPPFRFSASLSLPLRRVLLLALQHTARASLPLSGLSPDDESSLQPTASERRYGSEAGGWFSDSDAVNSFMQDEWLYGEEERRQMLRDGVIDAFWCDACRRTIRHVQEEKEEEEEEEEEGAQAAPSSAPLPLPLRCPHCLSSAAHVHRRSHITHSVSQAHLSLLFSSFLPRHIAHLSHPSFSVVDVGSRIGNVLFSALLLADVGRVVGVEKDSQMTALCSRLAQHYGLQDTGHRLQVLQGSVETAGAEAVAAADLLFFFNPFELHCDREEQRRLLRWLRQAFRKREGDQWKGQWLLSVPDMEAIYERAGSEVDVSAWLRRVADCRDAALYAVIG